MADKNNIPRHVAIIMDGNGRWAQKKSLPRTAGHRKGIDRVKEILKAAGDLDIKFVSFFAFSTENWQRPKREVDILMRYLDIFLKNELANLHKNNIRLIVIGESDPLPEYVKKRIREAQERTQGNTGLTAVLCLNYGSRQEIVSAAQRFAREVKAGTYAAESLNTELFSSFLYTAGIPDPDLLIRTSGEMRISNFLLWQNSYTELYFPKTHWPDFGRKELEKAIREYQRRERRFGDISTRKKDN